jgi:hypothetical protein
VESNFSGPFPVAIATVLNAMICLGSGRNMPELPRVDGNEDFGIGDTQDLESNIAATSGRHLARSASRQSAMKERLS